MKKVVVAICIVVALVVIAVFLVNSTFTKRKVASYLVNYFKSQYGLRVETGTFDYRIHSGVVKAHATDVRIYGGRENNDLFYQAKTMDIDLPLSSLWKKDFIIYRLAMDSPDVNPENLPNLKRQTKKSEGTFAIRKIDITSGALRYQRLPLQGVDLSAEIKDGNLTIPHLGGKLDTIQINASGELINFEDPHYQLNYEARGDLISIMKALPEAPPMKGPFETEGKVNGKTGSYVVEGTLKSDQVSVYGEQPFPASGTYKFNSADVSDPLIYSVQWQNAPATLANKLVAKVPRVASMASGKMNFHGPQNFWKGEGDFQLNLEAVKKPGIPLAGQIQGELQEGVIHLSKSTLSSGSTSGTFEGDIAQSGMNLVVDAKIGNAASLAFLSPQLRKVPGSYRIHSTVQGPFTALVAEWNLKGTAREFDLVSNGSYAMEPQRFQAAFKGHADLQALSRFYRTKNLRGQIAFDGKASGSVKSPVLQASIQGSNLNIEGTEIGDANANLQSNGKVLNGTVEIPSAATTAQGSYQFSNHHFELQSQMNQLALSTIRPFLPESVQPLDGTLNANLTASGNALRWKEANAHLVLQEMDVRYNEFQASINHATADLQNQTLFVDAGLTLQSGTVDAKGSYQLQNHHFEVQSQLKNVAASSVRPFLPATAQTAEGNVTANLNASGNALRWQDSVAHLTVDQANVKYQDFDAVIQSTTADLHDRRVFLNANVTMPQGNAHATGSVPITKTDAIDLTIDGKTDVRVVSLFQPTIEGQGPIAMNVHLGGTFDQPDYSGKINAQNFSVRSKTQPVNLTNGNVTAEFSGAQIALQAQANLNGAPLNANGTIPLKETPGNIHLTLQNFSIASVSKETNVQGSVSLQLDAQGTGTKPENWSGQVTLTPTNLIVSGNEINLQEPLTVQMTAGEMSLKQVHLRSAGILDTDIQGGINFRNKTVNATVHGSIELALLSSFMTDSAAEGKMIADVNLSGPIATPEMTGEIQIQNGMFRKFDSPILLEQVQLRAPLTKDKIVVETMTARMGGGTIEGSGEIGLKNWKPQDVNLQLKARSVGMNYPESFRSQLNADLKLNNQGPDYLVAGKVQVIRSTYREDIDPRDRLVNSLLSSKSGLTEPPATQGRLKLDVALETMEDFQMRNNLGKVQAGANLQVNGVLEEPRISGRVQVRERSEIYFEGNRFEVQRGNIDFYGQRKLNPVFDVELFAIATDTDSRQDYEITIPISGPLNDLDRRDPSSYPPLVPNQIYFLLLTGHADAQLSTASSRFFQQQLASYVSGQVFADLQRKLASSFGLTRVEIQPELVGTETNPGAKLVLGKDFTSSLSLVYSVSLAESQEQTWIANYKAPKNLSFRFVDQAQGSYTANVRHLVRFGSGVSTGTLRRSHAVRIQKVGTIDIDNESLLSAEEISKQIGIQTGDEYDFWNLQDSLEKIKQTLQDRGVLFSSSEVEETSAGSNRVSLKIKVVGKERREMVFGGYDVSQKQKDHYLKIWREGFSPEGVTELIRESLMSDLWVKGYHKAQIRKTTTPRNDVIVHSFDITTGPLFDQGQLTLVGADQYRSNELEEDLLKIYPGRAEMVSEAIHNFRLFERKITALYVKLGYLDTTVESGSLQLNGNTAIKEVKIKEGKQSRIAEVEVSDGEQVPADLITLLRLKRGSIFDQAALTEDEVTIGDFYERMGYIKAQVEGRVKKVGNGLFVTYALKKGSVAVVDSVEIRGNTYTRESLIRKRVQIKEGEILNQDKLASAQKNLTDLRVFHQVTVRPEQSESPDRYRVVVDVIERRHYELTYGFRYDTESSVGGEIQLTDLNLFGTGQSVSLYTRAHRDNQLYRFIYHSPTLSGLKWATLISASYENGDLLLLQNEKFDGDRTDFTVQKQYNIWNNFQLLPGYQFELLNVTPLETSDIEPVNGLKISRLIGNLFTDTRNDPFNTLRGTFFSTDAQFASNLFGSDVSYLKSFNQYLRFKQFRRFVWAQAYRVGLATDLPGRIVTERFFAGGSFTIRGLQKDQAGPKLPDGTPAGGEALFVLNQELRFPIWKWFGGAFFYDAGNVYSSVRDFNPIDLRHSIGIGLRLNSPFGIARFDYGINLNPENGEQRGVFHFALGQAF